MATLTYDPAEAQDGEFSAEELDSLKVGESLEEQQQQLLAGKFKDAEDLEQAYIELQRKLGDPAAREEQVEEEPQEEVEEEEQEVDTSFLERLWEESQNEYSDETLEALQKMDAADLAQMYLDYRSQVEAGEPEAEVLSEGDVEALQGIVGGEESYGQMMAWAQESLSEQEISMYDAVMEKGDPLSCYFAVNALAFRFQEAQGYDGQMLTGKAPASQAQGFRSQAELVRAMSDPRYDSDPAYRADVAAKLEASDLNF
ncbi:capsid assembly protein [Synechococcus phage S-CBP3]|uniref:Capsid assembly protein n=2 Tax=Synechococcus phage S-CBP3 TaxID=756276 RepID=I3ULW3_9CAUD|nr:head assembly [Synechococcus phage S-CBP3]YP_009822259.1 head assembly [Synechococcus phage S-CBP3]AFK66478.1 capsid assembly protein [Synechococcus phage S-CBP3]AGK86598.1 capsid assembly protein (scaffold) [Synechococcus phage S-CBP3]